MIKYADYDIVFQEIPDEVTLAINISNCPHRCVGCHSAHLQEDVGETLNEEAIEKLLNKYSKYITCCCFMGGDASKKELCRMADFVKEKTNNRVKTAWYSGCEKIDNDMLNYFNYIKIGAYISSLGGLNKKTTNQRLYRIEERKQIDITDRMFLNT